MSAIADRQSMPAPVRVLFCIDQLVRGGTELQMLGLIERLDRSQFEPYLLTIRAFDSTLVPADCIWRPLEVPRLFAPTGLWSAIQLSRWIKAERIGVVHTFFQDSTVLAGAAARLAGVPVRLAALRDLGFWATRAQRILMRLAYANMTGFVANSVATREHFLREFRLPEKSVHVISNGLDVDSMCFGQRASQVVTIGMVGNMTRQVKRFDLFVRAAALIASDFPSVTWKIIGEGHLRPELDRLARSLGLTTRLHFVGPISDVPKYLEGIDIGVICSDSEGMSNALLEYMSKGSAVIATRVGGNDELVEDGTNGLLVPPGNERSLADAMARLIGDPELRKTLAQNARQTVEARFSWRNCVSSHQALYEQELIGRSSASKL